MRPNKLAIIIPCFNEEEVILYTIDELDILMDIMIDEGLISAASQICFVDDGSKDKTLDIIEKTCQNNTRFSLIKLSNNFGQQNAMIAGMFNVNADIYVTIDADLQDDHMTITDMVQKYHDGCEIVYGVRNKRETDTFIKKITAILFYKLMNKIGVKLIYNHSEFRLLSRIAVEKLKTYREKNIFLRGIIPLIGLKSDCVYYDRLLRPAGKSKYSVLKLFSVAWTGITSFSTFPLRLITLTGLLTFLISIVIIIYSLFSFYTHKSIKGWTSIIMTASFFSGMIILSLGIIGEYIAKVFIEVKNRPLYHIEKTLNIK